MNFFTEKLEMFNQWQAVIKTYSKLKCYDPHAPEEHVPDLTESHRDVLGIVRAIAVKVRFYTIYRGGTQFIEVELILSSGALFCEA
jgi:hypothetical protein